jgi:hypothetical protein
VSPCDQAESLALRLPAPQRLCVQVVTHTLSADAELSFGIIRLRTLLKCNCTNASCAATLVGRTESVGASPTRATRTR